MNLFRRTALLGLASIVSIGRTPLALAAAPAGQRLGGRIRATWPGPGPGRLFESRDLAPTTDLLAVAKGILLGNLGLDAAACARVFPGSDDAGAMAGLIRI